MPGPCSTTIVAVQLLLPFTFVVSSHSCLSEHMDPSALTTSIAQNVRVPGPENGRT